MGSTASVHRRSSIIDFNEKRLENLELFTLIYIDDEFNRDIQQKLRSIIDYLCYFKDVEQCQQFLSNKNSSEKFFVIISNQFAEKFIFNNHHSNQINFIYILERNSIKQTDFLDEKSIEKYPKIRGIYLNIESLFEDLSIDVKLYKNCLDLHPITVYSRNPSESRSNDHLSFLFFQLFINEICLNDSSSFDSTEFFKILRTYYQTNANRLEQIDNFQENLHSSKKFLRFYLENLFLEQILQKSLLTFDLKVLFSLRFLITNFHQSLNDFYSSSNKFHFETNEIFYRSQILSEETFSQIKSNIGELLSINNFVIANTNRTDCLSKLRELDHLNKNFYRILFQIQIPVEYQLNKTRPIINISSLISIERTILFYLGSIFRIEQVDFDINNDCWIIQLTIYNEKFNEDFQDLFDYLNRKQNPLILADLLRQISPKSAEQFYKHILKENNQIECYLGLGLCSYLQKDFHQSLEYLNHALQISTDSKLIQSSLHNSLGLVYAQLNQLEQANEHFQKSLEFCQIPLHRASIHHNLALISSEKGLFGEEIYHYEQAFQIRSNQSSTNQLEIACLVNNLGIAYSDLNQYDKALSYLKQALEIRLKYLPENHLDIAKSYANIGTVYVKSNDLHIALDYFQKSLILFQKQSIPSDENIQFIEQNIQIVREKLN